MEQDIHLRNVGVVNAIRIEVVNTIRIAVVKRIRRLSSGVWEATEYGRESTEACLLGA